MCISCLNSCSDAESQGSQHRVKGSSGHLWRSAQLGETTANLFQLVACYISWCCSQIFKFWLQNCVECNVVGVIWAAKVCVCCRRRPVRNPPPSIWRRTRWLQPSLLWTGCCWSRWRPAALHRLKTAAITILVSIFLSFCHWGGTPGRVQNVPLACSAELLTYFFSFRVNNGQAC